MIHIYDELRHSFCVMRCDLVARRVYENMVLRLMIVCCALDTMAVGRAALHVEPPSGGDVDKAALGDLIHRRSISGIASHRSEIDNLNGVGVHRAAVIRPHKTDVPDQVGDVHKRAQGTAANLHYQMDLDATGNMTLGAPPND
jgi:hypothetical protein